MMMDKNVSIAATVGGGYREFWNCRKRYRVLKGGKASKKSTTTALWIIANMMKPEYREANTLVIRRIMNTHRSSTFAELQKATGRLGVAHLWKANLSPLEMTYLPTGQKILFRGFDDPLKLASTTVSTGYLCWVWLEEAFEIDKEDDFDKLDLSVPRGQIPAPLFKQTTLTFNPWRDTHWLKKRFFDTEREDTFAITTNYLCNEFLDDADRAIYELMRKQNPRQYDVAGLGNWGVTEGLVFENWEVRAFDRKEVAKDKPWQWRHVFGLDYGYTNDPTAFIAAMVNPISKEIYVYDEHYAVQMLNSDIAAMIIRKGYQKERIRADCAEPKSNDELRRLGISRLQPSVKGVDSVRNGIATIQEYRIIVHPACKNTATELAAYCWATDRAGNKQNEPEDRDNHLMDALRYAMVDVKTFRPSVDKPKPPRVNHEGLTVDDFRGGWG